MRSEVSLNRYMGSCLPDAFLLDFKITVVELKYCEVCGRPFVRDFAPTRVYKKEEYEIHSLLGNIIRFLELRKDTMVVGWEKTPGVRGRGKAIYMLGE
jgi:hypothetical protein